MNLQELLLIQQDEAVTAKKQAIAEARIAEEDKRETERRNDIYAMLHESTLANNSYEKFRKSVVDGVVTEALLCLTNSCIESVTLNSNDNTKLTRQLVSSFVQEEGAITLLNRFKRTSYLLSEMAYVCEKHINSILEGVNRKDKSSHKISVKKKEDFFNDLDKVDADTAISTIRQRVKNATEDFIDANVKNKLDIEKTLTATKEKVEASKAKRQSQSVQEAYVRQGRNKANSIRDDRTKSVYEAMVYTLAKTAMSNDKASQVFVENASLNMDRITEHCEIAYTFLTVLDTCKIVNVNEQYISKMLEDLKG